MNRTIAASLVSLLLVTLFAPACAAQDPLRYRLNIRKGQVFRGVRPFTFRAIETPKLFSPATSEEEVVRTFIRISEVGANAVWFDLEGLNPDGTTIAQENADRVREIMNAANYRRIGAICRVFNDESPNDGAYRENAVRAVAKAFQSDASILFWIDGPDSENLAGEMAGLAPQLMVAAPMGGAMQLVRRENDIRGDRPALLVGALPADAYDSPIHGALPDAQASYEALDTAMAMPEELEPWTPLTIGLSDQEKAEGFISLFNGTSLDAWVITGPNKQGFVVKDGAIEWAQSGGVAVRTKDRYDDFVLRLEFRISDGGNSGVYLRAPRANRASKLGFEFQIMGDYGVPPEEHVTGAIYDVLSPRANAGKKPGEWNEVEIMLDGPHFKATLNGEVVQDVNFDDNPEMKHRLRRGFIGLQDHDCPVAFRNIRIKEI